MRSLERRLGMGVAALVVAAMAYGVWTSHIWLILFAKPLDPPTPPILEGATAGGGRDSGGCPPQPDAVSMTKLDEAASPEVRNRLAHQFPPGTPERVLETTLAKQGFITAKACESDPSIHRATFSQRGGGFWGPYPAFAWVAWKVDAEGKVVWTKANVAYTGP